MEWEASKPGNQTTQREGPAGRRGMERRRLIQPGETCGSGAPRSMFGIRAMLVAGEFVRGVEVGEHPGLVVERHFHDLERRVPLIDLPAAGREECIEVVRYAPADDAEHGMGLVPGLRDRD